MNDASDTPESPEMVEVVDESNQVLDVVTRAEMRARVLRHRSVFIAVINEGKLLLHRRSPHKDIWPLWCDIAVGGVVGIGEDFHSAAQREMQEEIGLSDIELMAIDGGRLQIYDDESVSLIGRCFLVQSAGPLRFHDGEVVEAWWSTRQEFEELRRHERFLPDSTALVLPLLTMWK